MANTALNGQMEALPTFLRDHLAELATAVFSPAYLELSNDGRVLAWGGDLDCYGIGAPKQSMPVDACAPFLNSVFPLHQAELTLDGIETASGTTATAHISACKDGSWLVLLTKQVEADSGGRQFKLLFDKAMDVILIIDVDTGVILHANETVTSVLGYRTDELAGSHFSTLLLHRGDSAWEAYDTVLVAQKILKADGTVCPMDLTATSIPWDDSRVILMTLRDCTERTRAKEELARSRAELEVKVRERTADLVQINETLEAEISEREKTEHALRTSEQELRLSQRELRDLAMHLQSVREEESGRIAGRIHDELGQVLTALRMDVVWLLKKLSEGADVPRGKTEDMAALIDNAIETVQTISLELRPSLLDDLGLVAALQWQAQEFERRADITCGLTVEPDDISLDKELSTCLYRIFQEAMTNIVRHAGASRVHASLRDTGDAIILEIKDNGQGITRAALESRRSFGLMQMRERAGFWGGHVEIHGSPRRGTRVSAHIPRHRPDVSTEHEKGGQQ